MASISEMVNELMASKSKLEETKASIDAAAQTAEEMATQNTGMELHDTAASVIAVHEQIVVLGEQVIALDGVFDDIITLAQSLSNRSSSGG